MRTPTRTTPLLRFPEFKEDWSEVRLGDFLIPTLRAVPKPTEQFRAVGVRSHCRGTFQRESLDPEDISMDTLYVVNKKDLIVNITFAWEGAIAIVKAEDDGGFVSHRFPTYTFNEEITGPDFFQHVFVQGRFRYFLKVISPGGAGRNRVLDKNDFLKLAVCLPERPEQEKIAAFLSAVDQRIVGLARKKKLLLKYKEGVMQQIFDQKIRFKDDSGNDFRNWEDIPFLDIARLSKERFDASTGESRKCVELEHLDQGTGKLLGTINSTIQKSIKNVFCKGDILFGKLRPYLKKYWHADFDGVCSSEIWVIKPSSGYLSSFLFYLIQSAAFLQAVNISSGSKMPRAEWDIVSKYIFSVPTDEKEQSSISDFLLHLDRKLELVNLQLELTKSFKKGLLQQMFV